VQCAVRGLFANRSLVSRQYRHQRLEQELTNFLAATS
jgi:hypothetical protein